MVVKFFIILAISLSLPCIATASPSFDCSKAKGPVETTICEDATLGDLDHILAFIYQTGLKINKNPDSYKKDQIKWLQQRPATGQDLESDLKESYENRIKKLLRDKDVLLSCTDEVFKDNVNPYLLSYITLALLVQDPTTDTDLYNTMDDFKLTQSVKVSPDKQIIFLCIATGAYRETYAVFQLAKTDGRLDLSPSTLPTGRGSKSLDKIDISNNITTDLLEGNLSFDKEKRILSLSTRPSSYEAGSDHRWQFLDDGSVVWLE